VRTLGKRSLSSFLFGLLNVGWYVVAFVLAVTLIFMVAGRKVGVQIDTTGAPSVDVGPHLKMSIPISFAVDARTHRVVAPSLGIADAEIQDARGSLKFTPPTGRFLLSNAMVLVVLLVVMLWVIGQLRAVFSTLRDGRPFVAANASRIRRIAWVLIGWEVARTAVVFAESYYAMTHFSADGLRLGVRPDLNVFAIVNGLIILVIAEVFRIGTQLDEDQSLTV
jgi:hypothetical protein